MNHHPEITKEQLDKLEALYAASTEGEWGSVQSGSPGIWLGLHEDRPGLTSGKRFLFNIEPCDYEEAFDFDDDLLEEKAEAQARADADFIAAAHAAMPTLIAALRKARGDTP